LTAAPSDNDNHYIYTLLQPKGRIAEQGYVNTVEKQFKVKLYTQYKNKNITSQLIPTVFKTSR